MRPRRRAPRPAVPAGGAGAGAVRLRGAGTDPRHRRLQLHRVERVRPDRPSVGLDNYLDRRPTRLPRLVPPRRRLHRRDARPRGVRRAAARRTGHRPSAGDWFRVAIFTPVMLPMVVVAVLWGVRLQPRLRTAQRGLAADRARGAHQGLAGGHRPRCRGLRGLGLGLRRLLHDHLLRRLPADTRRGRRGRAPRRGRVRTCSGGSRSP